MFFYFYFFYLFFFFNDTATTEIYTLSLHDALPIGARQLAAHFRVTSRLGLQGSGGFPPMAACLEHAGEVLHDRRPLSASGRCERPLQAAADRLSHLGVERRQPTVRVIVGEPLVLSLAGRAEIGEI